MLRYLEGQDRTRVGGLLTVSSWKVIVAALAGGIVLGLGAVRLIDVLTRPLLILLLAVTLASTMAPFAAWLQRHMRRGAAVSVVYLSLVGIITLVGWLVVPSVLQQGRQLLSRLPTLLNDMQQRFQSYLPAGMQLQDAASIVTDSIGSMSASLLRSMVSGAFEILVIVFLSAYLLAVAPRFHRFVTQLWVTAQDRRVSRVLTDMAQMMGGYFRGAVIDGIIIGFLTWGVLTLIGRPFAAPLAVLALFGELVPYVGPIAAAIPAVALALLDSPQEALIVALAYVGIQQIEGHLVTPFVMHSQTDITPGTVLFAVVAGFSVAGILGAIAAVPLFAAGRVIVLRIILPRARLASIRRKRAARGHRPV